MSAKAEALRSSLHELEGLLKEYTPLMSSSMERHVDKAIKYGAVFAEVSSPTFTKKMSRKCQDSDTFQLNVVAKAVFGVASVTFEVCAHHVRIRGRSNA